MLNLVQIGWLTWPHKNLKLLCCFSNMFEIIVLLLNEPPANAWAWTVCRYFINNFATTISSYIINEDKWASTFSRHTCPGHNTPITEFHRWGGMLWILVPSLLHRLLLPSLWNKLIFISSLHKSFFQNYGCFFKTFVYVCVYINPISIKVGTLFKNVIKTKNWNLLNHLKFYWTDESTEKSCSAFSPTNLIVFCKYKKQPNVTPATHSKKVGTEAKQDWKGSEENKNTVLEGSTVRRLTGNR